MPDLYSDSYSDAYGIAGLSGDPTSGEYDDIYEDIYGGDVGDDIDGIPYLVIQFDAMAPQPGDFILDSSLLGGTDVVAFSPRFVPVRYGVEQVTIQRGVSDPDAPPQAGTATVVFDNWSGDFDPDNPRSVFNQQPGAPQLRKGMLAKFSVVYPAGGAYTASPIFTGRLESTALDIGKVPTSTFTFVDDLAILGQTSIPSFNNSHIASKDGLTGGRVRWVLDQVPGGFAYPPKISAAMTRAIVPTYGGDSALDEIAAAVQAEAGRVFVNRVGQLTTTVHGDEYLLTPIATLADNPVSVFDGTSFVPQDVVEYESLVTTNGVMRVVNSATVQRYSSPSPSYADMTGGDSTSAFTYGTQSVTVTAPLQSDLEAQALADYLGTRLAQPIPLISSVSINMAGQSTVAAILNADIGQQVTISRSIPYQGGHRSLFLRLVVIGMQWDVDNTGGFQLTLSTGPLDLRRLYTDTGYFIIGQSAIGGGDVLTPY